LTHRNPSRMIAAEFTTTTPVKALPNDG